MTNNQAAIQKQIKAFNKYLRRAEQAGLIDNSVGSVIDDLIGYDRMTKGGLGKAGTKYLQSLSPAELNAYSEDIRQARINIESIKYRNMLLDELGEVSDPKAAMWKLYDKLEDMGYIFDSDQVKEVVDNPEEYDYMEVMRNMSKVVIDEDYGLSDFTEWFNAQKGLE